MENKLLLNDVFLQLQSTFVTAGTCKNVEGEIKSVFVWQALITAYRLFYCFRRFYDLI